MLDVSIDLIKRLEQSTPENPIPGQSPEYKRFKELYDLATKYFIKNLHQPLNPQQETLRLITALLRISNGIPYKQPLTSAALLASVNHAESDKFKNQKLLEKYKKQLLSGNGAPLSSSGAAPEDSTRRIQKTTPTPRIPIEVVAPPSSSGAAHRITPIPRTLVEMGAPPSSSGAAQDTSGRIQKQTPVEMGAPPSTSGAALEDTTRRIQKETQIPRIPVKVVSPPSISGAAHRIQKDTPIPQTPVESTDGRFHKKTPASRTLIEMGAPASSSWAASVPSNLSFPQEFPNRRLPPSSSCAGHAEYTRLIQQDKKILQPPTKSCANFYSSSSRVEPDQLILNKRLAGVQAASTSSCATNDDATLARRFQKAAQITESSDKESVAEEPEILIRTKCGRLIRKPDRLGQN